MTGSYDLHLVVLSLIVAVIASYTTLELAGRVSQRHGNSAWAWLVGGAVSMGTGIWSMHFIGMLAFHLPVTMAYDAAITMLSMAIAILVSGWALFVVSRPTLSGRNITAGAALMGVGISAMHYTGMHAMQMSPPIEYRPVLVIASVIIAIGASFVALWVGFQLRNKHFGGAILTKVASATVMGLGISGMHYTGMAAARFAPGSIYPVVDSTAGMTNAALAVTTGITTTCILALTLGIAALDAHFAVLKRRVAERTEELNQSNALLQEEIRWHQLAIERAEYLAYYDSLTTLPNRSLFSKLLNQAISLARRDGKRLAVLFLDLDRFKSINDTFGHEAGDQLLQEVATRLKTCLRDSDTVARLGGDEFVALLPELEQEKYAATVAQKILSAVARPLVLLGREFRVTASIGISIYPQDGLDEQTLKKNADIAMYQAKEDGKNNFQFYSEKLNANTFERLALESGLRHALERNELQLHYQAKRDIRSGRITGMEALLRWQHPDLGTVAPMQFIPVAEESGLIVPIGKWVLTTACLQNVAWQTQGLPHLSMAVNLTARQFFDENLLVELAAILANTGMDAHLLELEITENLLMCDAEKVLWILTGLKDLGIRIAIDDFGIGYFSLSKLGKFPLDTIKIDRSFICGVASADEDNALIESIIATGRTLSVTVVAQGVETKEQADFLRQNVCDEFQGFYLNRPMPPDQIAELLRTQSDVAGRDSRAANRA